MAKESRVVQLQTDLLNMGYTDSLKALNWMMSIMNAGNGYARHDGRHYYYHLVDATQTLINYGITDETTITACILHDAEEDIEYVTQEMIASLFGSEVARVVHGVTKSPDIDYKTDKKELQEYLHIILQDWRMILIKTVDRMHNMSTLKDASPEKELRQALETETYFIPLFKQARKRYPQFSRFYHNAKTTLMPQIIKIKQHHEYREMMEAKVKEQAEALEKIKYLVHDQLVAHEGTYAQSEWDTLFGQVLELMEK